MATQYFVNTSTGNDGNPGTVGQPWQSLTPANAHTFVAGDELILTAGQTFTGPLTISQSGAAGNYICIGTGRLTPSTAGATRTAQASPATISAGNGNGINVNDVEYISIDNLIISGSGVNTSTGVTTSTGRGIACNSTQASTKLQGMRFTALTITGMKDGIIAGTDNAAKVGYNDLVCWGCTMHALQRAPFIIFNFDGTLFSGSTSQNSNIYVGYCHVYDVPGLAAPGGVAGDGIQIDATTTGTVEYCSVHDLNIVGDTGGGGAAGIAAAVADGVTLQFNDVYNVFANQSGGAVDGCGLDFESGATNCIAQYNYIHDNDGAGMLLGSVVNRVTTGNHVRANVFARNAQKNEAEIFNFGDYNSLGANITTSIYYNTIYGSGAFGNCYEQGTVGLPGADGLFNNILMSKAGGFCVKGPVNVANLQGNDYWAIGGGAIAIKPTAAGTTYTTLAGLRGGGWESLNGSNGISADPLLSSPTTGAGVGYLPGQVVANMRYLDPAITSPALNAGYDLSGTPFFNSQVTHDFHNVSMTTFERNIGAIIPQATDTGNIRLPVRF